MVYATYPRGTVVTRASLKQMLSPQQIQKFLQAMTGGSGAPTQQQLVISLQSDVTVTLVPTVKVLTIQNPAVDETTGRSQGGASTLILDLTPTDAQNLVFANDQAALYMGLLPPKNADSGYNTPGTIGIPIDTVTGASGK